MVHLLERVHGAAANGRGAADRDDRGGVGPGVGEAGDGVGRTGSRRRDADARLAGHPCIGVRHHGRGLLMSHVDLAHPELDTRAGETRRGTAHHVEDRVDARVLKAAGQNLLTAQFGHERVLL